MRGQVWVKPFVLAALLLPPLALSSPAFAQSEAVSSEAPATDAAPAAAEEELPTEIAPAPLDTVPVIGQAPPEQDNRTETAVALAADAVRTLEAQFAAGDHSAGLFLGRNLLVAGSTAADHIRALDYLEQAAAYGTADAFAELGDVYRFGVLGVRVKLETALENYEKAVALGSDEGKIALASLLLDRTLSTADPARATSLLDGLVKEGNVAASLLLGNALAAGTNIAGDGPRAVDLFSRGMMAGNQSAVHALGDLYRKGAANLPSDGDRALAYYQVLVDKDDRWAMQKMADMYVRAEGVPQNIDAAVALLETVGASGDLSGYLMLGDLFSRGEFIPIEAERAIGYYQRVADAGELEGLMRLGDLYRYGTVGVAPDASRAIGYYEAAAEAGAVVAANDRLGELYRYGTTGFRYNGPLAADAYRKAAAAGDNFARRNLAAILLEGRIIDADPVEAVALLKAASDTSDTEATLTLARLYSEGNAVAASYDDAVAYFGAAREMGDANAPIRLAAALVDGPLAREHSSEGIAVLADAVAAGNSVAVMELSRLMLEGKVEGTPAREGLSLLEASALGGNAEATRYLLSLYRDGYGTVLDPSPRKALALLDATASFLPERDVRIERIQLLAASGSEPSVLAAIAAEFPLLSRNESIDMLRRLGGANQNAFLYIVQQRLTEFGLYDGTVNGVLNGRTLDAFLAACAEAKATDKCDRGPLTPDAITVISAYLYTPRSATSAPVAG